MTENRGEIELYNTWFQIADADRDGVLSGGEAVQFFMRSGLPQNPTLFKVWQYVAGDRPALSRQEFYTAMKLVSLAQGNGGVLDDQQAMRLVNGLAGPIPVPQMAGLAPPSPPAAGGGGGGSFPTTAAAPQPARPSPAQPPPASYGDPAVASIYPPLAPDKAAVYQTAFEQLDGDRDGVVMGGDCFTAFMRSGLPKAALKEVWDVVAGDEGQLNRHQFIQCMYLIECAKIGIPIPKTLPPGQFPPIQGGMGLNSMVGQTGQDIYSAHLQAGPAPTRAFYTPGHAPAVAFQSQVPPAPAPTQLTGLSPAELNRLQSEREAALHQESERKREEEERVAIAARREFYTQSLADLRVAQSKVARTLVEAQQRCEMEQVEAERMESQYNAAYETFSAEHARVGPMLETLKGIEEEKAGLAAKMAALNTAVAQLENYDPEWETKERGECESMRKEITELTVKHESLQRSTAAIASRRDNMQAAIAALEAASTSVAGSIDALEAEVKGLSDEAKNNGATVVAFLQRLAPLYNTLYTAAKAAMIPLPKEALATIVRPSPAAFKYDSLRFGGMATEWESFNDEGFTIAATIPPDARLASLTSASLAAAEAKEDQEREGAEAGDNHAQEGGAESLPEQGEDVTENNSELDGGAGDGEGEGGNVNREKGGDAMDAEPAVHAMDGANDAENAVLEGVVGEEGASEVAVVADVAATEANQEADDTVVEDSNGDTTAAAAEDVPVAEEGSAATGVEESEEGMAEAVAEAVAEAADPLADLFKEAFMTAPPSKKP